MSVSRRPSSAIWDIPDLLEKMRMENLLLDLNNVEIDNLEESFGDTGNEILIGLDSRENEKEGSLQRKLSRCFPLKESPYSSRKMSYQELLSPFFLKMGKIVECLYALRII